MSDVNFALIILEDEIDGWKWQQIPNGPEHRNGRSTNFTYDINSRHQVIP